MLKNLASSALSAVIAIGASHGAQAAVTLDVSIEGTAGMPGFATYTMRFTSETGLIGSFRGYKEQSGSVLDTIALVSSEPLGQAAPNTPVAGDNAAGQAATDTHFLFDSSSSLLNVISPFETSTELGGVFGLANENRAQVMDLIQVVVPVDATIDYDLGVSESTNPLSASTTRFTGILDVASYALGGDANLDGAVDVSDLGALATSWQTTAGWAGGDFNNDGFVDVSDLGILATNWQVGVGETPLLLSDLISVVPEPSSIVFLGLGGIHFLTRRKYAKP